MSKIDEIRSEMVAAMKAGDKERKAALSFLPQDGEGMHRSPDTDPDHP